MRNGTQEELDAAREDATKIPFDALFKESEDGSYVFRKKNYLDDYVSVGMGYVNEDDLGWFYCADDLEVIDDN